MNKEQSAESLIRKLNEAQSGEYREYRFRASSLPYCQLRHVWSKLSKDAKRTPKQVRTYTGDFYLEVGTAIHTVIQRWLGRLGYLYGFWKCHNKFCSGSEVGPLLGEQTCEKCKNKMVYEEFVLRDDKSSFSGHTDGLIKPPGLDLPENKYVVLEVKSIGESGMDKVRREGIPEHYQLQASAYAALIPRCLGYEVDSVLFLFVSRADPRKMLPVWWNKVKKSGNIFDTTVEDYLASLASLDSGDYEGLSGICINKGDQQWCEYSANCFSPVRGSIFVDLHNLSRGKEPKGLPEFPESVEGDSDESKGI